MKGKFLLREYLEILNIEASAQLKVNAAIKIHSSFMAEDIAGTKRLGYTSIFHLAINSSGSAQ